MFNNGTAHQREGSPTYTFEVVPEDALALLTEALQALREPWGNSSECSPVEHRHPFGPFSDAGLYHYTTLWLFGEENTGGNEKTHASESARSLSLTHALEERQHRFGADSAYSAYLSATSENGDERRYSSHVLTVGLCRVLIDVHNPDIRDSLTELAFKNTPRLTPRCCENHELSLLHNTPPPKLVSRSSGREICIKP
jgi:hypothetical protein